MLLSINNKNNHNNIIFHCVAGNLILNIPAKLLCGGAAGVVAHIFSYPLDVTKRRMQLAMMNPTTHKYA